MSYRLKSFNANALIALIAIIAICNLQYVRSFVMDPAPGYCNHLPERPIPSLSPADQALVGSLKQVQVLIRHGARTPYAKVQCWQDYKVEWNNCNVTELMLASPSYSSESRPAPWLFRKLYDGSPNALGGNCMTGQLILEGYHQEEANGKSLRNAYLNPSTSVAGGGKVLFPSVDFGSLNDEETMYFRSDDEQRTLESGQILLHSLFNVSDNEIVTWHTGDYSLDQIYPNSEACPRLNTVASVAHASDGFQKLNNSQSVIQLNKTLDSIFGKGQWSWYNVLDCMMTATCTNQNIPDGSSDPHNANVMNNELFNATIKHAEALYAYVAMYNDSQWSKLALGTIAWHVRTNLEKSISNDPSAKKFVLFSGHDTTIMPFLAATLKSNWDQLWARYAAMISIELYSSSTPGNGDLFRFIYNGQVMQVPGCPPITSGSSLCDATKLVTAFAYGKEEEPCSIATPEVKPSPKPAPTPANTDGDSKAPLTLGIGAWVGLIILSLIVGAFIGAAMSTILTKRHLLALSGSELGETLILTDSKHSSSSHALNVNNP